jgi:hypothetical protein
MSVGEELAWGQRLSGFGTPELFAQNRQGETTLHNDARFDVPSRVALLLAGLYGVVMSVAVRGRTPFAPPRQLIGFFAVVSAYFAFRLLFLEHPTYIEAKYSEWPELCLAFAVAYWCADLVKRSERPRAGPVPRNGRRSATPLHVTDLRGRVSCEQDAITSARERRRAAAPDRATPRSS